ncbi:LutB/LldF family L-lactate oxidation iron-sulfur protein [Corynebacterium sp. UMB6689]|uniref:LutB/LldF family L-lactate oxidation iron-sulfur protein n=1 Tax=unclassified Corynebacterium TaxID=2624378 RepID=UPI0008A5E28A|nr:MULTISPECIES: LutB/LldF family L-lactate oxidation iron-sulfur protein [unclassified Corynebacterium]MDK6812620.1 LutB/LldF family L-lactate oxidation iron-sulfur protein [Corynebacterium sp. UMB6689]OFL21404.1 (4Fe-4S)-binding protein [Corynebacterium sp. HMSC062A03]OFS39788.1 (4Fe-4S)-binding protein [Corynebacterium sp. HMSC069E04]
MTSFLDTTPPRAPEGYGNLRGSKAFVPLAHVGLNNATQRRNLHHATTTIRDKRQHAVDETPDWEQLRDAGSALKDDVAVRMSELLLQFEEQVTKRGGIVHWARDAKEANEIIEGLIRETGETDVVKIKSMATQEIALNEHLEEAGIHAQETDLAELIVQLGEDKPSHILVPAIHRNRAEIRDIFVNKMPNTDDSLKAEPAELAEASRQFLREQFMKAKVAISGANFGVAETGTINIVESEGNGRMCLTLPETLITVMGIEKLVPTFQDLEVFLQLLPRSSTAERMNPYTSMWSGVTEGDGPQNFHIVLLDNGRTAALSSPKGHEALKCIRCSACLNVCPVYERAGGHAYGSVYPGPIGISLTPQLTGMKDHNDPSASLPYACSLCGRCDEVCPVRIPLSQVILENRYQKVTHATPPVEEKLFQVVELVWKNPKIWNQITHMVALGRVLGGFNGVIDKLPLFMSGWSEVRDTAVPPKKSFRQWFDTDEAQELLAQAKKEGIK